MTFHVLSIYSSDSLQFIRFLTANNTSPFGYDLHSNSGICFVAFAKPFSRVKNEKWREKYPYSDATFKGKKIDLCIHTECPSDWFSIKDEKHTIIDIIDRIKSDVIKFRSIVVDDTPPSHLLNVKAYKVD